VTGASADVMYSEDQVMLFGFRLDRMTLAQAVDRVLALVARDARGHYVVTPNLDHAALLYSRPELKPVYDEASIVVADGWPLIWASRILGKPMPERVAGSDLVPSIFAAAQTELSVYLLGAAPGVAEAAGRNIERQYPKIRVVGTQSPPVGFEKDSASNDAAADLVAKAVPDILVLGLGAPKQELWAYRERHRLGAKVILCAGATIDFLAGARARAPVWFQQHGLEWAYRAFGEPRRLLPRYARDAATLPLLLAGELFRRGK